MSPVLCQTIHPFLSDQQRCASQLEPARRNLNCVGVVLNRVPDEETATRAWERFRGVALKFLGVQPEYVGWVPQDEAVARSIHARTPVSISEPASRAALALRHVSAWGPLDHARTATAFYDRARRALT